MPRERPEFEPEAFQLWVTDAKENMQTLVEMTGIPQSTLYYWRQHYDWKGRKREYLRELAAPAIEDTQLELRFALSAGVRRLVKIIEDDEAKSQHEWALKMLFGMTLSPDGSVGSGPSTLTLVDARRIYAGNTDALKSEATKALQSNIEVSTADMQRGKRKTF